LAASVGTPRPRTRQTALSCAHWLPPLTSIVCAFPHRNALSRTEPACCCHRPAPDWPRLTEPSLLPLRQAALRQEVVPTGASIEAGHCAPPFTACLPIVKACHSLSLRCHTGVVSCYTPCHRPRPPRPAPYPTSRCPSSPTNAAELPPCLGRWPCQAGKANHVAPHVPGHHDRPDRAMPVPTVQHTYYGAWTFCPNHIPR
jgi:hypothetical protein